MTGSIYSEINENLNKLEKISEFSSLADFITAFSLKYDTFSIIENEGLSETSHISLKFQKITSTLHSYVNSSNTIRQSLCQNYFSTSNSDAKDFSLISFHGNPRSDKGEIFIRAFTPTYLYKRFDDLKIFSHCHMLVLPSLLADKIIENKIECVAFNVKLPFYSIKNPSKSVVESTSSLWEPYDKFSIYHDFRAAYSAALKIDN